MKILYPEPYLPNQYVQYIVAGTSAQPFKDNFLNLGIKLLTMPINRTLQPPLQGHIDMTCMPFNSKLCFVDNKKRASDIALDCERIEIAENLSHNYPNDVYLNALKIGNFLICNPKTVSKAIIEKANIENIKIISSKQGYSKCSVCPITDNAIITDDKSIYSATLKTGIDTLYVEKGSIQLSGYSYGFIGGCCGMIDKDKLLFIGNPRFHSDYIKIKTFLQKYNIQIISLLDGPLVDIGSFIPIAESEELRNAKS